MDLIKVKLALLSARGPKRLEMYKPLGDLTNPREVGLWSNEIEDEVGTPNMVRNDDVTLVLGNSEDKNGLYVNFKWRPNKSLGVVTLISKLIFVHKGLVYEYDNTETFAKPQELNSYGFMGSKLKLTVDSAYRRMRLVFRGHMKVTVGDQDQSQEKFVKLNFVYASTSKMYDMRNQANEQTFRQMYAAKRQAYDKYGLKRVAKELQFQDKHEILCRLVGDVNIEGQDRCVVYLWGFLCKSFVPEAPLVANKIDCVSVYCHAINRQAFHVGNCRTTSGDDDDGNVDLDVGYTCLSTKASMVPIEKPLGDSLDWPKLPEAEEFNFKLWGQSMVLDVETKGRRNPRANWFDVLLGGCKAWAYVECTQAPSCGDQPEVRQAVALSVERHLEGQREGWLSQCAATAGDAAKHQDKEPLVVELDGQNARGLDDDLVGSKAASLAHLARYCRLPGELAKRSEDFHVSWAVALTKHAEAAFYKANPQVTCKVDELIQVLSSLNTCSTTADQVRAKCAQVATVIESSETLLPEALIAELNRCVERSPEDAKFAVRSSSWGEDGEQMSAAGQLKTLLNVEGVGGVLGAIKSCFASKYSYENVEYKRQHGLRPDLPMAVIIQQMVACKMAGVVFTCDPMTGNERELLVTANYGLGESVVSGQTDPDSIKVRSDGRASSVDIVDKHIGKKNNIMGATSGSEHVFELDRCCLSDDQIVRLCKCARDIERLFQSGARDIEWGFDNNAKLFLFQSRPVTHLDQLTETEVLHETDMPLRGEQNFFTRANVGEVMPYHCTPLTLSYEIKGWMQFAHRLMDQFADKDDICVYTTPDMAHEMYHSYFSLVRSMLFPLTEGKEKPLMLRAMQIGMFGHELDDQPNIIEIARNLPPLPNPFEGPRFEWHSKWQRWAPIYTIERERPVVVMLRNKVDAEGSLVKGLRSVPGLGKLDSKLKLLYAQVLHITKYCTNAWENHIVVLMYSGRYNVMLSGLLSKYVSEPTELWASVNRFLGINTDVISGEIPRRVEQMASVLRSLGPEVAERFQSMPSEQAIEFIETGDAGSAPELAQMFEQFLSRFGHRCYHEFELSSKPWRVDKAKVVDMIKLASRAPPIEKLKPKSNEQVLAELDANLKLRPEDKRAILNLLAPKCQTFVKARELTKDLLISMADIKRTACQHLANELCRELRLPDPELIHYVIFDQLERLVAGPEPLIVAKALRRRQVFKRVFDRIWLYDEIIEGHRLLPKHLEKGADATSGELSDQARAAPKLFGSPASCGRVESTVSLIENYEQLHKVRHGTIMVTHSTDIAFSPVFPQICGLITEVGGMISHGAVVAREYGLPCIIGVPGVTKILRDGERIVLDADHGAIIRLDCE